jgi:hypothetical protein
MATFVLVLAMATFVAPSTAERRGDDSWKRCGRAAYAGGLFIFARRVGCLKARRVARKAGEQLSKCVAEGCRASGFTCRDEPNEIEGGNIVCSRKNKRVRFGYGGRMLGLLAIQVV